MNTNLEILPADELSEFILMNLVRPRIDDLLERGIRVEAQTVFVAQHQRKTGPRLGAVKRPVPVCIEIRCQSLDSWASRITCHSRLIQPSQHSSETLEWDLIATVRRDAKGFFVQECQVAEYRSIKTSQTDI